MIKRFLQIGLTFSLVAACSLASTEFAMAQALAAQATAAPPDTSLWGWISPTVFTAASAAVGVAVTWAAARFHALTGVQIAQKYQDDLHRAADTGIHLALDKGGTLAADALTGNAKLAAIGEAAKWVNSSVPQALKALGVTPEQVYALVAAKLSKVVTATPSATAVAVAPPAAESAQAGRGS